MSFQNLNKDELLDVAEFFAVDVEAADADNGPTKKEIVAALSEGDEPVTWDDYKETYLESKKTGKDKSKEQKREELVAEQARLEAEAAEKAKAEEESKGDSDEEPVADEDAEDNILLKYERKNPTWQVGKYTFTKAHPFLAVPASVAENLIRGGGFRQALPSEVTDYYN